MAEVVYTISVAFVEFAWGVVRRLDKQSGRLLKPPAKNLLGNGTDQYFATTAPGENL